MCSFRQCYFFICKQRSWLLFLITGKISECYKSMKADELRVWTHVYSVYCLFDIILKQDLIVWSMFVSACHNACKRSISMNEINASHDLFRTFSGAFARLCGWQYCTPNMHLHLHLKNCLLDYGPVYAFWCFSYERFNGILGAYHVNNHDIAIQLMRRFTTASQIRNTSDLEFDCFQLIKRREKDIDTQTM